MWYENFSKNSEAVVTGGMELQLPESQTPAEAAKNGNCSTASKTPEHPWYPGTQSCCLLESMSGVFVFVCVSSAVLQLLPHVGNVWT